MRENQSIGLLLKRLWQHISPRRRWQFGLLLLLMMLASITEIISIGAVLPFLGVLTAPERIFELPYSQPIIQFLNIKDSKGLILPLTFGFAVAALIAGIMRLILLWVSTRLTFASGAELSISIYHRTLYQPYAIHCARNSSEVINGISSKTSGVINVISLALTLISSTAFLVAILIALLSVNPLIALVAFGGFGSIYIFIVGLTRKQLAINSRRIADESIQVIKSLQEGLGGIRDVLIDGSQATYCQIYNNADLPLKRAQASNSFIGISPRYAMEALGMILIAVLAYTLTQQTDGIVKVIPVLGALALGAQRLLPVLQQAYSAWSGIQSEQASLYDVLELLDQPLPDFASQSTVQTLPLPFNKNISLKQLDFKYSPQSPYVLKEINLNIDKGARIGFIGATGSGKSTLLDIVMGLLQPTSGSLIIDNQKVTLANQRAWQANIAHVPQVIFLADTSIEENIAFGVPKDQIDIMRVREASEKAKIAETIESWPNQYQTFVGERGVRLSGGQRQRIGIARALYKNANIIIFDEATSALDNETEQAVMQAIDGLTKDLTVLIIAHRLSTLKNCTQIVELADGRIKCIKGYQDIAYYE
jgi:ABC-type multidrug transport system fused ATPase/permease subunit